MLDVANVVTGYGDAQVLRDVSLSLSHGQSLAVLGRNGAGKSTLLKVITGLLPVWSGTISLANTMISETTIERRARAGIGYVPEDRRIFATLTVDENLLAGTKPSTDGKTPWSVDRVLALFPEVK